MALFEFLMVLVSIIIGLAIAELFGGAARVLRSRKSTRTYWLHTLFQVGLFFGLLQVWWESWNLRDVPVIAFQDLLLLLGTPILFFLIAHLLFPNEVPGADLEEYYFEQAPLLWSLVAGGVLVGLFQTVSVGAPLLHVDNILTIPGLLLCTSLALSRRKRVHSLLAPLILAGVVLDTILAEPALMQ